MFDTHLSAFAQEFVFVGVAGGSSKTALAPLERLKILLQVEKELVKQGRIKTPYLSVLDCAKRVVAKEGVHSMWRGNCINVVRYVPAQTATFAFKDFFIRFFDCKKIDGYKRWFLSSVCSGGLSGIIVLCFTQPFDFLRTRLAADAAESKGRQFGGSLDCLKKVVRRDGILRGVYRGFGISCAATFVFRGFYFALYDIFRELMPHDTFTGSISLAWCSTLVAGVLAYPFDTVRRRMMMTSSAEVKYKNSRDCFGQIIKNEGFTALMRGGGINFSRSILGAILLAVADSLKPKCV